MSRPRGLRFHPELRFPRVSGDKPLPTMIGAVIVVFSLRERG